jgi:MYXO-CTERM domain-containing protein
MAIRMNLTSRPEISPRKSASSASGARAIVASAAVLGLLLGSHAHAHAADCGTYAWDNPSPSYPAGVEHALFHSAANSAEIGFNIYTPTGAATDRYPVIYFLHGKNGTEGTMVDKVVSWVSSRVDAGMMRPAILVFANGAVNSAYADAKDGSRRIETSVLDELVPYVDAHYPTNACREQRAISGFPMGGNGALLYAFKRPELFASVVAYAGAVIDWAELTAQHPETATCMFGDDSTYYDQYTPWTWLETNAATLYTSPRIRVVVGDQDSLQADNEKLDARLTDLGIPHDFELVAGCKHDHLCLWTTAGDRGVKFHEAAFAACGSSPPPDDAGTGMTDGGAVSSVASTSGSATSGAGGAGGGPGAGGAGGAGAVQTAGGESGCSCTTAAGPEHGGAPIWALGVLGIALVRRRRGLECRAVDSGPVRARTARLDLAQAALGRAGRRSCKGIDA